MHCAKCVYTWLCMCVFKHQKGSCMHQKGSCIQQKGSCIHQKGSCIHQKGSCIHQKGSCIHQKGSCIHQNGSCVHQKGSCVHQKRSCIHQKGSCIHQKGSCIQQKGSCIHIVHVSCLFCCSTSVQVFSKIVLEKILMKSLLNPVSADIQCQTSSPSHSPHYSGSPRRRRVYKESRLGSAPGQGDDNGSGDIPYGPG